MLAWMVIISLFLALSTYRATAASDSYDASVEYYTKVTFQCNDHNKTLFNDNRFSNAKKYWLVPDGRLIWETGVDELGYFNITQEPGEEFNITIMKVDDPVFGVYYCLVIYANGSVDALRRGLNVDGPNYDDLIAKYRHNAMVGGIAAAALFAVISVTCIIWQCRYDRHKKEEKAGMPYEVPINGYDQRTYDNDITMEMDEVTKEKRGHSEATNDEFAAERL